MSTSEAGQGTASDPKVRVFGGMGVEVGGAPVSIGGPRQRRLLALLAIRSGSVVDIDWLAEYLWDDDERPDPVAPTLRTNVSRLRSALPEAARKWITTESAGYRLAAPADAVDHQRFARLRAAATAARDRRDPQSARDLLDEALELWRGEPFRELEDLDWARANIEQLRLDRLEMFEERWEAELDLGRHTQITGELAAFTAEHGDRDRAVRQYALALHRSGRTPEALRVLERHRRSIAEESGLDPSAAVVELEAALLADDPALDIETEGRPLRGYRLLEQTGAGAFAVVWRGIQPSVGREVAIKQIRADLATQPEFIRRFEAEAHLVARIEHPHIVPLIDYWRDPDSAYLVMRWLGGGTLERRLDDGPLSVAETLAVAREIGAALAASHGHGVVHRDVKTANILLDEQGHAYLTDFGIALEAQLSAGPEAALSPGSPAYASPEQIRREPLGPEADVFSLGVVLFECLTGTLPFANSPSADVLVERQLHAPYPAVTELRDGVPEPVAEAIARATAKDPADRFSSISDFVAALEASDEVGGIVPLPELELENPYVGLRAFDDGDEGRFYGRERFVSELVSHLGDGTVRSRCLVVVGPSGSGKSSVVRAGLLPALREGALSDSDRWFVTTMVPGADPFASLEAALLRIAVDPPDSLPEVLRDGPRGVLRAVRSCLGGDDQRVVVVVDQIEELFTQTTAESAAAFLDALTVAIENPASPLVLVATLRADYYDRPLVHPRFAPLLKQAAVELTPLAPDELERAIVEPARRLGVELEPGLAARIAAETLGRPAPLPLLQHVMGELFERRDGGVLGIATYERLGGLSGALAARAEALYGAADDTRRAAVRTVFGRMTEPGSELVARRRVRVADLGSDDSVAWVLARFGESRLVTFDRDVTSREPTVEVAHEALLWEWPRLAAWLADDRETLRAADVVGRAASDWDEGGREDSDLYRQGRLARALDLRAAAPELLRPLDAEFVVASEAAAEAERRAELAGLRRLRRLVGAVAAALVLALVAGGVAVWQQRRADDEAERAVAAAAEAETQAGLAREQTNVAELATLISRSAAAVADDPDVAILLALEAHRREPGAETEQAVLAALAQGSLGAVTSSLPRLSDPAEQCEWPLGFWSADGSAEYSIRNGNLASLDLVTGTITDHGPPPVPCAYWFADPNTGRRWATDTDGLRLWFGPVDGPFDVEVEFDEPQFASGRSLTGDRLVLFTAESDWSMRLVDTTTGDTVGSLLTGLREPSGQTVSGDGALVAVSGLSPDAPGAPDGDGRVHVVDAVTGEPLFHVDTAFPTTALAFDDATGELIAATDAGRIVTIDLESQSVVSDVETGAASQFIQVGVAPDGLVVAVSEGQIELVDRATGPTGDVIELPDGVAGARVRPDGATVVGTDTRADTYEFGGSALVEQTFEVDPFAAVWVGEDVAIVSGSENVDQIEVIDLGTGEASALELTLPSGDPFVAPEFGQPYVVAVEGDHVAFSPDGRIARWNGDRVVAELALGDGTDRAAWLRDLGDAVAILMLPSDGPPQTHLVGLAAGGLELSLTVDTPEAATIAPSPDGGLYVMNGDGTLLVYDAAGELVDEHPTGARTGLPMAIDESSGRLAFGSLAETVIVDPVTGAVEVLDRLVGVDALEFVRGGELLIAIGNEGDVRLWDVERGEAAGLLWDGNGSSPGSYPYYDETTSSVWVATSGRILRIPLDPERWLERACEVATRDLTQEEWDRLVPGGGAVRSSCV